MFLLFFSRFTESNNETFSKYFLKRPFSGQETTELINYPGFSKWLPVYRGPKEEIVSEEIVGMPPNVNSNQGVRYERNIPDFDESAERIEFTCKTAQGKAKSANGRCKFLIYDNSGVPILYPFYVDHGETVNKPLKNPLLKTARFLTVLVNNGTETVYFGIPEVKVFFNHYDAVNDVKIEDKGKYKIIRTEVTKEVGKTSLRSIGLLNAYFPIPSTSIIKYFPIIANETHIIGSDLFFEEYYLDWNKRSLTTKGFINESFLEVSFDPYSNEKIVFSYICIEVNSTSLMDALEKWHSTFPEVYNRHDLGNGAWISAADMSKMFNASAGNEFEDRDIYLAHWQWACNYKYAKPYLPAFGYTEALFIHTYKDYDPKQSDVDFLNEIKEYANDPNDYYRERCEFVYKYHILNENGNITKNPYSKWAIVPVCLEKEIYDFKYNIGKEYVDNMVKHPEYGVKVYGYGLDSFTLYSHFPADPSDTKMRSTMPFYYLTDDGKRYIPTLSGYVRFFRENKGLYPHGHMSNAIRVPPQYIKYLVHSGFEVFYCRGDRVNFGYNERIPLLSHRYQIGSLGYANICDRYFINDEDFTESIFSIYLGYGIFPSVNRFYSTPSLLEKTRKHYLKWGDAFRAVCNNTEYFANGLGKVKLEMDPEKQNPPYDNDYKNDFQEYTMLCDLENSTAKNPYCYVSVFIDYNKEHNVGNKFIRAVNVTVDTNSLECFFVGSDMTCSVEGNKATITMSAKSGHTYRTSVLRFRKYPVVPEENDSSEGSNAGAIAAGIIIPIFIIIVALGIVFYLRKRKEDKRDELQEDINV